MNPKTALGKVRNVRVKREADGSTLLHVVAGWNNAHKIVLQLLCNGIPPDEQVGPSLLAWCRISALTIPMCRRTIPDGRRCWRLRKKARSQCAECSWPVEQHRISR